MAADLWDTLYNFILFQYTRCSYNGRIEWSNIVFQ
jgi:hypothetical protein